MTLVHGVHVGLVPGHLQDPVRDQDLTLDPGHAPEAVHAPVPVLAPSPAPAHVLHPGTNVRRSLIRNLAQDPDRGLLVHDPSQRRSPSQGPVHVAAAGHPIETNPIVDPDPILLMGRLRMIR